MITEELLASINIPLEYYNSLSEEEKSAVNDIIGEIANKGSYESYEQLYYADYDEIPVDFITFVSDDRYLGRSTRNGKFLYDFWKQEATKIFNRNDINEVALSGSIGIGKTTAACIMMSYHLYKTMCMKDPQAFFGLSPGSEIVYAFLNNTLSSSYKVGYDTVQSFLKESPWFLKHGVVSGRSDPKYYPEKGFGFLVGSRSQHTLGRHIICSLLDEVSFAPGQNVNYEKCLTGDTVIKTTDGDFKIEDLEGKKLKVYNYSPENDSIVVSEECTVIKTMETNEIVEIEVEDGTVIRCTPFHRLMLKDGTYKMAKDLSEEDELMDP